jgi:enoyl-CoA hydratase/carnithine racemase
VVVGRTSGPVDDHPLRAACDVVLDRGDAAALDAITATVARNPQASVALVLLLRGSGARSVEDGLVAESRTYSTLQAGPEFAAWLASHERRSRGPEGEPVRLERDGGVLTITLDRPHVRNALHAAMRDALVDAFALPVLDPSITEVHLRGAGPAYSAGGDLDEFGTFPDPETAHDLRLQQSVGRAIHAVRDRVTAHLHGACAGSGIELPAFAARVVAAPDAQISLPELSLGLVPGAGGTVSLPRRIGRWRTAQLALTGQPIEAPTALAWGLVDELAD